MTLDDLPRADLAAALHTCLAAPAWVEALVRGRPHGDGAGWLAAADVAYAALDDADVLAAAAAHPRIGAAPSGATAEDAASRREQAGVTAATDDVRAAVARAVRAYEDRFGRVFLVRAAGRTPQEILGEARRRLAGDDASDVVETREQLRQIMVLRLERLLEERRKEAP